MKVHARGFIKGNLGKYRDRFRASSARAGLWQLLWQLSFFRGWETHFTAFASLVHIYSQRHSFLFIFTVLRKKRAPVQVLRLHLGLISFVEI